jgi:hypothetical protein
LLAVIFSKGIILRLRAFKKIKRCYLKGVFFLFFLFQNLFKICQRPGSRELLQIASHEARIASSKTQPRRPHTRSELLGKPRLARYQTISNTLISAQGRVVTALTCVRFDLAVGSSSISSCGSGKICRLPSSFSGIVYTDIRDAALLSHSMRPYLQKKRVAEDQACSRTFVSSLNKSRF